MKQGADYVATGHYAKVVERSGLFSLMAGDDANKDQSYFLWTLVSVNCRRRFFRWGISRNLRCASWLANSVCRLRTRKDSQGLCFIGKIDVKDFLSRYIDAKPGNMLSEKNEIIGQHKGALFYTLGERHGFSIDPTHKTPDDAPYYVVDKDIEKNTITVSQSSENFRGEHKGERTGLVDVHWTSGKAPQLSLPAGSLLTRARYREALAPIELHMDGKKNGGLISKRKSNTIAGTVSRDISAGG